MTHYYQYLDTPIGQLTLMGTEEGLTEIKFPSSESFIPADYQKNEQKLADAAAQLQEYFAGKRKEFTIPLLLAGTDFQKTVWNALRTIPYGQTISYGELAHQINNPKASRAVGAANGCNKIPIIIPCHRVIGANKTLTGFAGGVEIKQFLLNLERA